MVDRDDMPAILADLQSAAYLVYWNKRYGESDPKLSGQNFTLDGIKASELTKLLQRIGGPRGDGVIKHLAKKNEKLSDIVDIKKFYVQLKNEMIDMVSRRDPNFLEVGNVKDLPPNYTDKLGGEGSFEAQKRLQAAVVKYGGGGKDIDALENWVDEHIADISILCEA